MSRLQLSLAGAGLSLLALICGAQAPKTALTAQTPVTQPADAKIAPAAPAAGPATSRHQLDQADLEAFFDGILPLQLERSDIAGASVLVMKDGNVLLQKGYGYADMKSKKPVDPNSTIFRLASISKLFTWVSVMQLQEQGKLDLDTDVNRYLDFQIQPAFGRPVTLRNLMTHTGGFEEAINNIILTDPKKAVTLRDNLIQNQPVRRYPPGVVPAYSNYGVGLASYIVQRASGEPFEQYVQDHIFGPLGMTHSSFYQPLQKPLSDLPSEGYRSSTIKPAVGFELFNPVGAGGLSSSASDMGRFGQALLNGGELYGKRILKQETLALMWTPQYRASDQLPPICMGFYQTWRNDLRWIGHEGDLIAFHSLFFVEPKQNIVLFVSYNSAGGSNKPRPEIIDFFSDRYFPATSKQVYLKAPLDGMKAIAGTYQTTRRSDSTKLALSNIFNQREVTVDKDGVLHVEDFKDLRGHPVKWKAIGKDLWQEENGQSRIFVIRDGNGKVVRIAFDFPGVQAQRVAWYDNGFFVSCAAGVAVAVLASVFLAVFIRGFRSILFRKRPRLSPQSGTIWLTFAPRLAALWWIFFISALLMFFAIAGDDTPPPDPSWFKWFLAANWVTALAILWSFFAVISGIRIWWRADLRWITKIKFALVGLSCLILSWVAVHWNLIGPSHRI